MFTEAASIIGKETDTALMVIGGICIGLLAVTTFLMLYFVIRYSRKRNPAPSDIEGSKPLEFSFLGFALILVLFMFYLGWGGYRKLRVDIPAGAFTVKVTGQMWLWTFEYENGRQSHVLNLPVNRPVRVRIISRDMIHSFYVPAFRVKQDALPASERNIWFIPDREGTYDLFCAEYCGMGHTKMITKVAVMSEEKFKEWYEAVAEIKTEPLTPEGLALKGKELYASKGCNACHSIDGTRIVGPTWKGLYGSKVRMITKGEEREVSADDEYIHRSELEPNADVVAGFPPIMPSQKGILTEGEMKAIIEYIKTLK